MARSTVVGALALALALVAGQSPASVGGAAGPLVVTKEGPLLGAVQHRFVQRLARLEPETLRPLPGPRPAVGRVMGAWAYSPDRTQLAVFAERNDGRGPLRFIDLGPMRTRADLRLVPNSYITTVVWPRPDRVLAVHLGSSGYSVLVVEPRRPRIVRELFLEGALMNVARSPDGLVALVGGSEKIGPSRLVTFDANGVQRALELGEIWSGWEIVDESSHLSRTRSPALAVDSAGRTAYVVDPGGRVAAVDLGTLTVSYHTPASPQSLLGRFANWLSPAAQAKAFEGPIRSARWVGDGLLAVYGHDHYAVPAADGPREASRGAGLSLIDVRAWTVRRVDPDASFAREDASGLLTTSGACDWDSCEGDGLTAYTLEGRERFHTLQGKSAWIAAVFGTRAYVSVSNEQPRVVDLQTGSAVLRPAPLPLVLTDVAGPDFR